MFGDWFKCARPTTDIQVGSTFRRSGPGNLVETAKVVKIAPDALGIPHVRYDLQMVRDHRRIEGLDARRTLNLETFSSLFTETVEA